MSTPRDRDQLREQLEHLQDNWNSYKKSLARLPCRRSSVRPSSSSSSLPTTPTTTTSTYIADSNYFDIIHDSPKTLVSSLQHPTTTLRSTLSTSPTPPSSTASAADVKANRLAACSGRTLLDELERAKDDEEEEEDDMEVEEVLADGLLCSGGGSSTVVHGAAEDEGGSDCSRCSSCGCEYGVQQQMERIDDDDSSSSSSEDEEEGGGDGSMKWLGKMTGFCFVFVVVLAFLLSALVSDDFPFEQRRVPT